MHYVTPPLKKMFDPTKLPIILHMEDTKSLGTEDKLDQITDTILPLIALVFQELDTWHKKLKVLNMHNFCSRSQYEATGKVFFLSHVLIS